jgi:hypothetical protein
MIEQAPSFINKDVYEKDPSVSNNDEMTTRKIGNGALVEAMDVAPMRKIDLKDGQFDTDLPEDIHPFEDDGARSSMMRPGLNNYLLPSAMDNMSTGHYTISGHIDDPMGFGAPSQVERTIDVLDGKYGKTIALESLRADWYEEPAQGTEQLLAELGYTLNEEGRMTAAPTPETVKRVARNNFEIEIELVPDEGRLSAKRYIGVFADGKYPVSTGTEPYYKHDIEDDHLTAMALGGKQIQDALQTAAKNALEDDTNDLDKVAGAIDTYTVTLRAIVADYDLVVGEPFGKEMGRETLLKYGANLGIPPEATNDIIATAQKKAAELGMNVHDLD